MTRFLLIRHAVTEAVGHSLTGRLPGVHLTPRGRAQADKLVERLKDIHIDSIHTSPLERTRETAQPLAQALGLPVNELTKLHELHYGDWQGKTLEALSEDPLFSAYNQTRSLCRIPGGEMPAEAQLRMVQVVERLHAEHPGDTHVLVSHGDPLRCLVAYALGMPLDFIKRLHIAPASISVLDIDEGIGDTHPSLLCINDLGALPCLRDQGQ